jgi:hypothetical protein
MTDEEILYWFDLECLWRKGRMIPPDSAFVRQHSEAHECVVNALEQRKTFRRQLALILSAVVTRAKGKRQKMANIAELMIHREDSDIKHLEKLAEIKPPPEHEEKLDVERARQFPILEVFPPGRRAGRSHVIKCPFHQERTGSFHIYPDTNSFYCFGCAESGDVIDAFMKLNNVSFKEAVTQLTR